MVKFDHLRMDFNMCNNERLGLAEQTILQTLLRTHMSFDGGAVLNCVGEPCGKNAPDKRCSNSMNSVGLSEAAELIDQASTDPRGSV